METNTGMQILAEQINRLNALVQDLLSCNSDSEKLNILYQDAVVIDALKQLPYLNTFLAGLTPACDLVIKSVLVIGQGPLVFQQMDKLDSPFEDLRKLLDILLPAERFYAHLGGIVGYHLTVLKLISGKQACHITDVPDLYSKPLGLDLSTENSNVKQMLRCGIEALPQLAEIYPVGGAGDRLQLQDEKTGEHLPVAQLRFVGKTLLEWLIGDIQAREYLYYKLTGQQTLTPVAMMTSHEKENHQRILAICEQAKWFGRPKEAFRFFTQPLVPVITEEGDWCLKEPLKLALKPGGHGVMWKLAVENGIFDWFNEQGRHKAIIRQINNPIAGIDSGLLTFAGVGVSTDKSFGFASCYRLLNAAEGMVVLVERPVDNRFECTITNIEYTDFAQKGIQDTPVEQGSLYSAFPANTNILFADLNVVKSALTICPIPGTILNMKTEVTCLDKEGNQQTVHAGRLESTMQNIADCIVDSFTQPPTEEEQSTLQTFVTYNHRHRTISVTKKSHIEGQSTLETPAGCYYDLQLNAHELLTHYCSMNMPCMPEVDSFTQNGPSFLAHFHPALGPVFSIVAAKIRGGRMHEGAEMTIEATEVELDNIQLDGSLCIKAENIMGHENAQSLLEYSTNTGKCCLKNVMIANKGLERSQSPCFWKGDLVRTEALTITIHGNGEFHAEDVSFTGDVHIEVPSGVRIEALPIDEGYRLVSKRIDKPTWYWGYSFAADDSIILEKR